MITRLAVRFERAGLFFLNPGEDLVSHRLGDIELLETGMAQFRIWDFGFRICLEFFEPAIYLLDTRK